MKTLYFDCAATTRPALEVLEDYTKFALNNYYNPSAYYSNVFKEMTEATKSGLCKLFNCEPTEIIYTSGATESNNIIAKSFVNKPHFYTETEHHSAVGKSKGILFKLPVDDKGIVQLDVLSSRLSTLNSRNYLVSVNYVNNETGVIQPLKIIAEIVHKHGGLLHSDMTQAIGHIPMKDLQVDVDFASFSGHKFHAPKGIGGLYVKKKHRDMIKPLFVGGEQQGGMRAGTENTSGIIAINKAVSMLDDSQIEKMREIKTAILNGLKFDYKINGDIEKSSCNILNIQVIGFNGRLIQTALALTKGIYIGVGSACNNYSNKPSDVLSAMGLSDEEATSSIRLSWDRYTEMSDVEILVSELNNVVKFLRRCNSCE